MKQKIVVLVLMLLSVPVFCNAQDVLEDVGVDMRGSHHRGEIREKVIEKIGLTQKQQEQIKENREKNAPIVRKNHRQMKIKRLELQQEFDSENLNVEKIKNLASEIKTLHSEMIDQRVENIVSLRKILTAEQYRQLHQVERMRRMQHHKKNRNKHRYSK